MNNTLSGYAFYGDHFALSVDFYFVTVYVTIHKHT